MTVIGSPPRPRDVPARPIEVLFPEARRRRRRRCLGWLVLALCAALALTLAVVSQNDGGPRPTSPRAPSPRLLPAGIPAEIVGWTSSFHLEVLSTRTGATLRTLASNVSVFAPGLPAVSVTNAGTVVFDSDPIPGVSPPDAQGDQIFTVPISGGPVHEVAPGFDPAVSPDGRSVAFVASNGVGEAPYVDATGGIDIATLSGSAITGVVTLHPDATQVGRGVSNLSWSPDSHHLSFDLLQPSTDSSTSWTLDLPTNASSLASAVLIPLHPAGVTWNGYLGTTSDGRELGIGVFTAPQDEPPLASTQRVVSIDPASGSVVRELFALPAAVCTSARTPHTPSDCNADFSNALDVDQAGSSILISGVIPLMAGTVSTSGLTYLYRWTKGFTKPVRLSQGVLIATWGPAEP
jgi:hypothetical protein